MTISSAEVFVGNCTLHPNDEKVKGEYVELDNELFYCIRNYDQMPPFFMNLVSSSDHWVFISSTGGLSAGRRNAESALFPYYTVDKITENADNTGHIAILFLKKGSKTFVWEPFSDSYRGLYHIRRNLYKNIYGNKLLFEEVNRDLALTYRYSWQTSEKYGFVKTATLINQAADVCSIQLIDGLQNLLPYGATTALQSAFSNLLNGYKRNELEPETGLGIFTLSSTLTDLAEPSESLKATTVWQAGLPQPIYLLSTTQLDGLRHGSQLSQESDIRGRRGAYIAQSDFRLDGYAEKEWSLVAEVNQDSADVVSLVNVLKNDRSNIQKDLFADIDDCTQELLTLVGNSDGLQMTGDHLGSAHHFANVLFNIMRGGIFVDNHQVNSADLRDFIRVRNGHLLNSQSDFFVSLPDNLDILDLLNRASFSISDVERLCYEFLPLTFSRRHGDPSRPWNQFSINIKHLDGSRRLDYQGNWRDIFQNWEPLAYAYPAFAESMICKFINATTADGYNPYRITGAGIEWEVPAPDDPWANIGYWSDHQIIYLQKLLEVSVKVHPGKLVSLLTQKIFSHANVPYRIKKYSALIKNWYDTIEFDRPTDEYINHIVDEMGTDGKLLLDANGQVFHVTLTEKLMVLLLAKLSNLVLEGGIWMNTQRPEWNDANNALVGKGLSVVTICYLRRFLTFFENMLEDLPSVNLSLTQEVAQYFYDIQMTLGEHQDLLSSAITDKQRRTVMDKLGQSGSKYRWNLYQKGFSGEFIQVNVDTLKSFLSLALQYIDHTILANKRQDHLFHAYNVLNLGPEDASVRHLYEMLEGQVAVLSSGLLSGDESLALLKSLRNSAMYRADQHSYMLYPDREIPGFLHKNLIPEELVRKSDLITTLVNDGNKVLVIKDDNGQYHFNGSFRNARDVEKCLLELKKDTRYQGSVEVETHIILDMFEHVFDHNAFTGRSGTFFAYEGLGSIYWHMVSKLLLAAQEVYFNALESETSETTVQALVECYYDIRAGIGFNKKPDIYGAFPTDPYSHTPAGQGAKQPGMTGQVKEECVTRFGELGIIIDNGLICFTPVLLRKQEFLNDPAVFEYIDVFGKKHTIELLPGTLSFTFCQVPIVYHKSVSKEINVIHSDNQTQSLKGNIMDSETSQHLFNRDGYIKRIDVFITNWLN